MSEQTAPTPVAGVLADDVTDDLADDVVPPAGLGVVPGARARIGLMVGGVLVITALAGIMWNLAQQQERALRVDELVSTVSLPAGFATTTPSAATGEPNGDGAWCFPDTLRCWVTETWPEVTVDALVASLGEAGASGVEGGCVEEPTAFDGRPLICHATGAVAGAPVSLQAISDIVPGEDGLARGATTVVLVPNRPQDSVRP